MWYAGVAYAIASGAMLSGSTATINARVVGPVVSFEESGVVPVVICGIVVVCTIGIVYKVVVENKVIARRRQVDAVAVVRSQGVVRYGVRVAVVPYTDAITHIVNHSVVCYGVRTAGKIKLDAAIRTITSRIVDQGITCYGVAAGCIQIDAGILVVRGIVVNYTVAIRRSQEYATTATDTA